MFDLLIKKATIVDGSGKAPFKGDIAVYGGNIQEMGPIVEAEALKTIDAQGLHAAPGFIDLHSHSDMSLFNPEERKIKLSQGITSEVIGNCGISIAPTRPEIENDLKDFITGIFGGFFVDVGWAPYDEFLNAVGRSGCPIRIFGLVGHSTLRLNAMGFSSQTAGSTELKHMKRLLSESLDAGAVGLSSGLIYAPGAYADTKELIAVSSAMKHFNGTKFYASHLRGESHNILSSIDEALRIGREAGVPVHISHLKIAGKKNWHMKEALIKKLDAARQSGLDLTCDVYPYRRVSTTITSLLPAWVLEGGRREMTARLGNKDQRKRISDQIRFGVNGWQNTTLDSGWDNILISSLNSKEKIHMIGKSIHRTAHENAVDPLDFFLDLILSEKGAVTIVASLMDEENVSDFLTLPYAMVGSDGLPTAGNPHPRLYGAFPRVLKQFVREKKVLKIETAIHKMTGMTADRLRKNDIGLLTKGAKADIVLFDSETIADTATYENPRSYPKGISFVIIGGKIVLEQGQ